MLVRAHKEPGLFQVVATWKLEARNPRCSVAAVNKMISRCEVCRFENTLIKKSSGVRPISKFMVGGTWKSCKW